jgi:hypothetical protein
MHVRNNPDSHRSALGEALRHPLLSLGADTWQGRLDQHSYLAGPQLSQALVSSEGFPTAMR